jgi:hypothetical protein
MATVTMYRFTDADGNEEGSFTTFEPREAQEYAMRAKCVCMAVEYEYADEEIAWDFTDGGDQ